MNQLVRKSASSMVSSMASKQIFAALISTDAFRIIPTLKPSESPCLKPSADSESAPFRFGGGASRGIHFSTGPLEFRSSMVAQAEYAAIDDFSDDEKVNRKAAAGGDEGLDISKIGISEEIVSCLAKKGITKLFPIQKAVLEPAMQGRDMIGRARTGTGKTLAFGIPIMDKILKFNSKHGRGRNPLALAMAPTRELARQVEKEFKESTNTLDTLVAYGGVPIQAQIRDLQYGVDVVVGTPGRIIDLIKRGALNLSEVQFVVLDEADQMLAVGFEEAVEIILQNLPQKRQTMMFSATMPSWIRKLTQKYLKDPLTVDLVGDSDQKLADGITLYSIATDAYSKSAILGPLITEHAKGGKCIVFTQTKRDADRLAYSMGNKKFSCEALHGDISQSQRERVLAGFRDGRFNILVATDVASRGLDIPNVDLVIHYELPSNSEIFVHRSGRTGRAGKKGNAILIHTENQVRAVKGIEQDVGSRFKELPRIAVESGDRDMFGDMGGGGRGGRSGYGQSSGFGGSGYPSSSYGGSRQGGFGGSSSASGRFGSFGGSSSGRSGGGYGNSSPSRSSSYGGFGGFSSPDRSGGSGGFSSPRPSGSSGSNRYGGSSSSPFGGFGDDSAGWRR